MNNLSLKEFHTQLLETEEFGNLEYSKVWHIIDKNEIQLTKDKIIDSVQLGTNTKKTILDFEKMKDFVKNKLDFRKKTINKFIKESKISISYTSLYNYINENMESLKRRKIIDTETTTGNKKRIVIIDFEKMENEIENNF